MGILIGIVKHSLGWIFTVFALGTLIILFPLTLGLIRKRGGESLLRFWGRGMRFIAGVSLETEGLECLRERDCRIVTINHASTLDMFIVSALTPKGSIHIIKREARFLPIIGQAAWLLGVYFLDRRNKERAVKGLAEIAQRMQDEKGTVCIAPEGTRSKDGTLQPFKLGVFHLAMASGAKIYPMLIEGANELWPRKAWVSRSGRIRVRLMQPMDSSDFEEGNLREKAALLRDQYQVALNSKEKA